MSLRTKAKVLQSIRGTIKLHWLETSNQGFWIRPPTRHSIKTLIWAKLVLQDYLLATVMAMILLHNQVLVNIQGIHTKNSPRATIMAISTCSHLLKIIRLSNQTLVFLIRQAPRPNISLLNLSQWYKILAIGKTTSQKSKRGATQSVEMATHQ